MNKMKIESTKSIYVRPDVAVHKFASRALCQSAGSPVSIDIIMMDADTESDMDVF